MFARLLALMLAGSLASPALADDASRIRAAVAHGQALPLPRILEIAHQRMAGEIIGVELQDFAARLSYAVRMLAPDGQLRAIRLDARTGATVAIDVIE